MSVFKSEAEQWFRFHISKWLRNYARNSINEYQMDDLWRLLGHLDESDLEALVDKVMRDPAIARFPMRSDIDRHLGAGKKSDTRVDMARSLVWGVDGSWQGDMEALSWENRQKIAEYVLWNLVPDSINGEYCSAQDVIRTQQLEFISKMHPPTFEKRNEPRRPKWRDEMAVR